MGGDVEGAYRKLLAVKLTLTCTQTHQVQPMFRAAETLTAEWMKDVKDTIRACIATNIAVSMLKKNADRPSPKKRREALGALKVSVPTFGELGSWHRWWVVPKIV
jgi:hypothetical protein